MPLTRFAPAPTGYLHLGHVANALSVWRTARERGASVLLRIEDHDRQRCRPEYEQALLEDLDWLGFLPDRGSTEELRRGPSEYRQSDCGRFYEEALQRLQATGHRVYGCDCSRSTIADPGADLGDAVDRGDPTGRPYWGRCRDRGLTPGPGRGLRVVIPPGAERFEDLRLGPQVQEPALQCGDLLLRDRLGNWTYQFAVVVDDIRHGVDLVVRGEDLLESTGRQLRLARMLGRSAPPLFLHHPLILKPGGEKLSKANRDTSVRDLRAAGITRGELLGRAAELVGLPPE
jgi:glutamyl-tRNA synthetase/glutamyl-Q tRNA(Asp) synthetase